MSVARRVKGPLQRRVSMVLSNGAVEEHDDAAQQCPLVIAGTCIPIVFSKGELQRSVQ